MIIAESIPRYRENSEKVSGINLNRVLNSGNQHGKISHIKIFTIVVNMENLIFIETK